MLKIKAPIQTYVRKPILSIGEDFAARIKGNYAFFDLSVTGEDFLHLLSAPPEVFLMEESGGVNISGHTDIREYNTRKIEVINNFLNRILLSDNVSFTYQDRVFITDVLHKMGITDTVSFMKRVENIRNEQHDFSRRLEAYWNHTEEMKNLVEEYFSAGNERTESTLVSNEENVNILHGDIFKRLQTGTVYQILSNFYQEERGVGEITSREILNSEQKETAEKLLLQSLINEVRGEELPLIYKSENIYETKAALPLEDEEDAKTNIVAAALLSLIRSTYVARREESITYGSHWYEIAGNLYRSEENTFQRITENLHRNMQLIEAGETNLSVTSLTGGSFTANSLSFTDIDARMAEISHYITEGAPEETYGVTRNTDISRYENTAIENIDYTTESPNVSHTDIEEIVDKRADKIVRQELTRNIREDNHRMYQTYEAHLNALTQRFEASRPRRTREEVTRAQKEALTHPTEFMMQFREEKEQEEERRREFDMARRQLALTGSPDAFTLIQQFLENPKLIPPGVQITRNDIGSLIYDNRQVENSYRQVEQQLKISDERIRHLEQLGINRNVLSYLTESEISEFERGETDRAHIEHIVQSRIDDRSDIYTEKKTGVSEERVHKLEQLGISRKELSYLTETEISEYERGETDRAHIEHLLENRVTDKSDTLTERKHGISEERIQKLERLGISRKELESLTETGISELEHRVTERADTEHIREDSSRIAGSIKTEKKLVTTENTVLSATERELDRVRLSHARILEGLSITEQERVIDNVSLVHKREETGIDEEILEEIQKNRRTSKNIIEQHTSEERHVTDEKVINTVVDQRLREQERRLDDLIQEGMSRQMNNLSDRVYRQIEKRLANERSRRGV